jgi:hypothetical protein
VTKVRPADGIVPAAPMDFSLTDEQRNFVAAIQVFFWRECGTSELPGPWQA